MPLLAQAPDLGIQPRLKLFLYGDPGVGKTMASIQFPHAYIIDGERGTDHYASLIRSNQSVVMRTVSHHDVIDQLRALLTEHHEYRTLVIDPISTIYSEMLDQAEEKVGSQNARHFGEAQKHMKRIANLMTALDMNIVVTAHAKPEYGPNLVKLGSTFDGWRRLPYVFDVVLELVRERKKHLARVIKSRINTFPDGQLFEWSYDEMKKRYDAATLERAAATIALATPEQVQRLDQLLERLRPRRVDQLKLERWLAKAGVSDWTDMPEELMARCIQRLEQEARPGVAA